MRGSQRLSSLDRNHRLMANWRPLLVKAVRVITVHSFPFFGHQFFFPSSLLFLSFFCFLFNGLFCSKSPLYEYENISWKIWTAWNHINVKYASYADDWWMLGMLSLLGASISLTGVIGFSRINRNPGHKLTLKHPVRCLKGAGDMRIFRTRPIVRKEPPQCIYSKASRFFFSKLNTPLSAPCYCCFFFLQTKCFLQLSNKITKKMRIWQHFQSDFLTASISTASKAEEFWVKV